ncbi:MAG: hypothetical protein ACTS42_00150 [Candidatus Hodgkinia cicadicola]
MVLHIEDTDFITSEERCRKAIELTLNEFKIKLDESPMQLGYLNLVAKTKATIYKFYGNAVESLVEVSMLMKF